MVHRSRRSRNVAVALAVGTAAAALTMLYASVRSAPARGGAEVSRVPVLTATRDLPVGTSAAAAWSQGAIRVRRVDRADVAPDAVREAAAMRGLVVVQPVYAGEQLTLRRLGPSGAAGIGSSLRGDLRILQVTGTPAQLLAGTLRDGDHVDVVATVDRGQQSYATTAAQNVLVLVAPEAPHSSSGTGTTVTATVRLTTAQAQALFYVMEKGTWAFMVRPPAGAAAGGSAVVGAGSLLAGR